jgi:hypothetical protein
LNVSRKGAKAQRTRQKDKCFEQEETEGAEIIKTPFPPFPPDQILVFLFLFSRLGAFA